MVYKKIEYREFNSLEEIVRWEELNLDKKYKAIRGDLIYSHDPTAQAILQYSGFLYRPLNYYGRISSNFFNTLPARSLKNIVVIKYNHMKWRKFVTIFLTKKRFILCAGIRTFEIIKMLRISKKLGNCAVKKLPIFASEIILARVGQQKLRTRMIITIHGMLSCNFLPCVFSSQKRKGATIRRT